MIKNAREYQITKAQAAKFERALSAPAHEGVAPALVALEHDAIKSQLADLRAELDEYDALIAGKRKVVEVEDLAELPRALIQARIAAGLSQRELAERLGLKEQQIQRYEATEYATSSLSRLLEVVRALKLRLHQDIVLPSADVSARTLMASLQGVGFDREFVRQRLVLDEEDEQGSGWRTALAVGRVLHMPVAKVVRGDLAPMRHAAAQAMFKLPAGASEPKVLAYSAYARYVAELVLTCLPQQVTAPALETEPHDVFHVLKKAYGGVTFRAALHFLWDRGFAVLPLRDSGAFHGAFWRINGRSVVVLKQRTDSGDRWLVDALHEYAHGLKTQGAKDAEFVELEDSPFERRDSEDERTAVAWATAAALNEREQELAQTCIDEAGGNIPRLKRVVSEVAEREGVPRGVLANYLAHKLERFEEQDWWGTAATLQATEVDPYAAAQEALFARLELHRLDRLDRDVLTRALAGSGEVS
jgi:transcriptional regulator with XRE-family HTH domain